MVQTEDLAVQTTTTVIVFTRGVTTHVALEMRRDDVVTLFFLNLQRRLNVTKCKTMQLHLKMFIVCVLSVTLSTFIVSAGYP